MRIKDLGKEVKSIVKGNNLVVVTDENVEKLYLKETVEVLQEAGFKVDTFIIPAGEKSKSGSKYLELVNFLAEIPLTRADGLVALGGGVVGDLTGFAAATYLRGIKVIQVPTTLLAAVDSSVGGKTAINLPAGKNLVGAFHQPALVCCDENTLKTLEEDVLRDGMAEVIKYGVIADKKLFSVLSDKEWTMAHLKEVIEICVSIKRKFVEEDELDTGVRQMLNFGHTIGHGIEKASDYKVSHGSSVAKGMLAITKISVKKGWCKEEVCEKLEKLLKIYDFDLDINEPKGKLYDIMKSDKKRKGNYVDLVVPEIIGRSVLKRVTIEELGELL